MAGNRGEVGQFAGIAKMTLVSGHRISPEKLLCPARFDICAKHVYARWRGDNLESEWGAIVYDRHILATNSGTEIGKGSSIEKLGLDEFRNSYNRLLDDIKHRGFDSSLGLLPIGKDGVLANGAHRAAAFIYYQKTPLAEFLDSPGERLDYEFYDRRGLDLDVLDFMAVEYALMADDCRMFCIYPSAAQMIPELRRMISELAGVVCEKQIKVESGQMPLNIVNQIYSGESFLEKHCAKKAFGCFQGDLMHIMLICAPDNIVAELKERIRGLVGIGNDSIHSTDGKNETLRLARIFFNRNSLHYLRNAYPSFSSAFRERMAAYKNAVADGEDFCVHGSAVMEAYGIRKSRDLDYVAKDGGHTIARKGIEIANDKPALAGMSVADAVEDPRNYFYCDGIKFASLRAVMALKQNRGEEKDRRDVRMIKRILSGDQLGAAAVLWRRRWILRQRIKLFRRLLKARLGIGKQYKELHRQKSE